MIHASMHTCVRTKIMSACIDKYMHVYMHTQITYMYT